MWNFLKANLSRQDVITCLEGILSGESYVWSDFTDVPIRDPELDEIRLKVLALEHTHPPGPSDYNLNPNGQEIVRSIIKELQGTLDGRA